MRCRAAKACNVANKIRKTQAKVSPREKIIRDTDAQAQHYMRWLRHVVLLLVKTWRRANAELTFLRRLIERLESAIANCRDEAAVTRDTAAVRRARRECAGDTADTLIKEEAHTIRVALATLKDEYTLAKGMARTLQKDKMELEKQMKERWSAAVLHGPLAERRFCKPFQHIMTSAFLESEDITCLAAAINQRFLTHSKVPLYKKLDREVSDTDDCAVPFNCASKAAADAATNAVLMSERLRDRIAEVLEHTHQHREVQRRRVHDAFEHKMAETTAQLNQLSDVKTMNRKARNTTTRCAVKTTTTRKLMITDDRDRYLSTHLKWTRPLAKTARMHCAGEADSLDKNIAAIKRLDLTLSKEEATLNCQLYELNCDNANIESQMSRKSADRDLDAKILRMRKHKLTHPRKLRPATTEFNFAPKHGVVAGAICCKK